MPDPINTSEPANMPESGENHELRKNGSSPGTPSIDSATLMKGQKELLIDHLGEIYRLRVTRNGKLILHK